MIVLQNWNSKNSNRLIRHILDKIREFELELKDYDTIFEVLTYEQVLIVLDYCDSHSSIPLEFQWVEKIVLTKLYSRNSHFGKYVRNKYSNGYIIN